MRLPEDNTAVSAAREHAREWAAERKLSPATADALELVVSELVTNAVRHAEPPYDVTLSGGCHLVHGTVSDGSTTAPRPQVDAHYCGFGLRIVSGLSKWGYDMTASGKEIWFDIEPDPRDEHLEPEEPL
jgi:two-component sensor histidine kinase